MTGGAGFSRTMQNTDRANRGLRNKTGVPDTKIGLAIKGLIITDKKVMSGLS